MKILAYKYVTQSKYINKTKTKRETEINDA